MLRSASKKRDSGSMNMLQTPMNRMKGKNSFRKSFYGGDKRGPRRSIMVSSMKNMIGGRTKKKRRKKNFNKSSRESERSDYSMDKGKKKKKFNLQLLYIPKKAILETEKKRGKFKSFDAIEGRKEFLESSSQKFGPNSISGLTKKLKHNSLTQQSYLTFYKRKHKTALSEAINDMKDWEIRQSRMPKVKVIRSSRVRDSVSSSLPVIRVPKKNQKFKKSKMTDEERKKKIKVWKYAWDYVNKDYPIEAREGSTFTLVGGFGWLVGGINHQIITTVWKYELNKTVNKESKFEKMEIEDDDASNTRFNHSAAAYNKRIFIFGGERFTSSSFYTRVCLNDVKILDTGKQN